MLYVTCLNSCALHWRPSITEHHLLATMSHSTHPYLSHKKLPTHCAVSVLWCLQYVLPSLQDSSFPFSFLSITMTMLLFMLSLSSTSSWILFSFNPLHWMEFLDCDLLEGREQVYSATAQHKCGIHSKLNWGSEGNLPHCSLLLWRHLYLQFYFYLEDSFWEQVI